MPFCVCSQVLLLACVAAAAAVDGPTTTTTTTTTTTEKKLEPPTVVTMSEPSGPVTTPISQVTATLAKELADKDVSILKQINKVNDDGSYTFGYEASDGSFKVETRDVAGNVKGMFGFVDETGRLKRVSYSASNSSGFHAAAGSTSQPAKDSTSPTSVQTILLRRKKNDEASNDRGDGTDGGAGKPTAAGVKKVLVSKRPIAAQHEDKRREGNDLRRQLPMNEDAPDVYGVHGRSSLQSAPVSPVVSALMSELDPIKAYRPMSSPPTVAYDRSTATAFDRQDTISRQAQDEDEPSLQQQYRAVRVHYRQPPPQSAAAVYQQTTAPYPLSSQPYQQQPVVYPTTIAHQGPNLAALRDELMELILSFVQTRVSQLMSVASYHHQPYQLPYQQPNYYVPSYYQGPRMPATGPTQRDLQAAGQQQEDYVQQQQSSPMVTQTLKDGLIRMLLSTSPRYDSDGSTAPRLTYRRTTQSTPVRNVQIIDVGNAADSRPVTTETPD